MGFAKEEDSDERGPFYDPENLELEQINKMVDLDGKDVLEVGCRTGRLSFKLRGYKKLTAIDKAKDCIAFCKKKNKSSRVEFICAEAGSMPFEDSSFDVVLAAWSVGGSENIGGIIWDVCRVLKPNGVFLIVDESGLGELEEVKTLFYPGYKKKVRNASKELRRQLSRFFSKIEQRNMYIPEVYPNIETAVEQFISELRNWGEKSIRDEEVGEKLKQFVKGGKVVINRGVVFFKAKN